MKSLARLLTVAVALSCLNSAAHADRKSREEEKARQQRLERQLRDLEYILKHESDGTLSDRQDALKAMLSTGVAPDEAYWQAGYIKQGDQWVSVRDRWLTPEQEQKVDKYAQVRTEFADSDEDHYKLAQWCAENGFDAQAYAHLKAVLLNHPDHAGLRQLLGYQKIGNRWMNADDYEAAVREADRLAQELQEWGLQVVEIRDGLHSNDPREQHRAKAGLAEIKAVSAVPAMEIILLPASDMAAAACVDQLCQIDHRRSSIALCKVAMFLPASAESTRAVAIKELKTRPLDDFVPILLGKMQTTFNTEMWLYMHTGWEHSYGPFNLPFKYNNWRSVTAGAIRITNKTMYETRSYSLDLLLRDVGYHDVPGNNGAGGGPAGIYGARRRWDRNLSSYMQSRVGQFNNTAGINSGVNPSVRTTGEGGDWIRMLSRIESDNRSVIDDYRQLNTGVRLHNDFNNEFNDRVTRLMGDVTGHSREEPPEYWWDWWIDRIEMKFDVNSEREIQEVFIGEVFHVAEAIPTFGSSCFIAGTPVWTDRGPRPIDQLHVGDMALSKDVETGELMYRPIIRTTTRQPKPLVTIDLGPEQITSTGGHPFFVPGAGWVRARELKAGQFLHTPTGTIRIDSVGETPEDKTYNLVVDGFHTYFVGMSQALVHDVSITSPTDAVVPGLLDR